jgi:Ca2+-transporting ATPase
MALVSLTCASAALTAALSSLKTLSAWIMTVGTLGLSALLVQVHYLAGWLHISPLHWDDWGIALAGGFLCVLVPLALFQLPGPRSSSLHKHVH